MNLEYVQFIPEDFHPTSRVWVYQSNRLFTIGEAFEIQDILKEFTEELHEAGLIDKKKGCIIEWKKEGHLYINNKKQQSEISDKYSRYYNKDGYVIKLNCDNGNAASL